MIIITDKTKVRYIGYRNTSPIDIILPSDVYLAYYSS